MKATAFIFMVAAACVLAQLPPMPVSAPLAREEANEPVTYAATVSWNANPQATRYLVESRVGTNATVATSIIVPFIAGSNVVSVRSASLTATSAPVTLVWEGYPGVICLEQVQRGHTPTGPWVNEIGTLRRVTNPATGFLRYQSTRHDTLIGGVK